MSVTRSMKIAKEKFSLFKDLFIAIYDNVMNISDLNQLHFIFDSYLSHTLKSSERLHRKSIPIELATIKGETPLPIQMDKFWACDSNKIKFQQTASDFILDQSTKSLNHFTVTSGIITDDKSFPSRSINPRYSSYIVNVEALTY